MRVPQRRLRSGLIGVLTALAAAAGAPAALATTMSYYGGPVVHQVDSVFVEWGPNTDAGLNSSTSGDPAFLQYLADQSGSVAGLGGVVAQYADDLGPGGTGENAANRATFLGGFEITPGVGAGASSATVSDSQIQTQLQASIIAGTLPVPAADGLSTLYVVLFPPGDAVAFDGATSASDFCAYHSSFVSSLPGSPYINYVVLPDNANEWMTGCGGASTALANETAGLSEEYDQAVTDPLIGLASGSGYSAPLAWYDSVDETKGGEIGAVCDGQEGTMGMFTVDLVWSVRDAKCVDGTSYVAPTAVITPPQDPVAGSAATFSAASSSDPPVDTITSDNGLTLSSPLGPGIVAEDWNWGDGTPDGSGASATHTYASAGSYNVLLTVTDALGFTATQTAVVNVAAAPTDTTTTQPTSTQPTPTPTPSPTGPGASPTGPGATSPGILVSLGQPAGLSAEGATLVGTVDPGGLAVSYFFQYGTTSAYGQSSPVVVIPAGQSAQAVMAVISGLKPGTTYHYRLYVTGATGASETPDATLTTPLASSPKLTLQLKGSVPSVPVALSHGIPLRFTCSAACRVTVVGSMSGAAHVKAGMLATEIASGSARLSRAGRSTVTVRLTRIGRRLALAGKPIKLTLVATAQGTGTAVSTPHSVRLVLRAATRR